MARSPQDARRGFCQFEKVSVDKAGWISKELNLNMTYQGNNFRGKAWLGWAGRGQTRQGEDQFPWPDTTGHDLAWQLKTRQGTIFGAGRGGAWPDQTRQGSIPPARTGQARHGLARHGAARLSNSRQGLISPGEREPTQSNTNKIT